MTVNLPSRIRPLVERQWREHLYASLEHYCVALTLWDVYSRQLHVLTGPLLRMPSWAVDNFVEDLLKKLGVTSKESAKKTFRATVRLPDSIYPLAQKRKLEEHYRSGSAYIAGLVLFALDPDVPQGKGVPHHKLAPLMQQPKWIREKVFEKLAEDFGNPLRTWPAGVGDRIDELLAEQLQLRLGK